ncbi:MAG: cytochrome c [Ignavibacteriales bacterium]|nr:cytochrome c [Ignavibacteriales bacterium]
MISKTTLFAVAVGASFAAAQDESAVSPETLDGKLMYDSWCARCHGMDGRGIVEGLELDTEVPDFTDCSFTTREPRKDWLAVIMDGGPARGLSMTMPAWSESITQEQAEAIIGHIKTFCTEGGWPPGELNFRRAQVTTKAFPENEALLVPTYTRYETRTKLVYEHRTGPAGQWEVAIPLASVPHLGGPGLGDVELAGKYALFFDESSLSILSGGLEIGVPTGSSSQGRDSGRWKVAPFVAGAIGLENLVFQSSAKIEKPLGESSSEFSYNLAVTLPFTREKKGLFSIVELNGVTDWPEGATTLFFTPQLYLGLVKRGHLAFSLGVQIPFVGEKPFPYKIAGFFLWEYADGGLWW